MAEAFAAAPLSGIEAVAFGQQLAADTVHGKPRASACRALVEVVIPPAC